MSESIADLLYVKESDEARKEALLIAQAKCPKQSSYLDVPVYPQGYKDPDDATALGTRKRPTWLVGHKYKLLPLSSNWLPSNANSQEILNLYYQLECHAHERCAISLQWGDPPAADGARHKGPGDADGDQQEGTAEDAAGVVAANAEDAAGVVAEDATDAVAANAEDAAGDVPEDAAPAANDGGAAALDVIGGASNGDGGGAAGPDGIGGDGAAAGGGIGGTATDEEKHFLSLPSFRVKQQSTPCTSYREFAEPQDKEKKKALDEKDKEQRNKTLGDTSAQAREEKRAAGKISRKPLKERKRRKEVNKQNKDQENQPVDNEDHHGDSEDQPRENNEQPKGKKYQKHDSYHVIRFKDRRLGKDKPFVDFLRQDSSGYILGFRAFAELRDAKNAYWCCFEDAYEELCSHLPFFKFKKINFNSGYSMVSEVVVGMDTIEKILDAIYECYSMPATYVNDDMDLFRHIMFVLFGEGPRFEFARAKIFSTIDVVAHKNCPKFGGIFNNVVNNWSNVCRTTFYLLLMLLEEDLAKKLVKDRRSEFEDMPHSSHAALFAQMDSHWLIAQKRCACIGRMSFQKHFQLTREKDTLTEDSYGRIAYKQLIGDYIPFLLYLADECEAIIMRRDLGYKRKIYPALTSCGNDKELNAEADADFWQDFTDYQKSDSRKRTSALKILVSSLPVLDRYGFSFVDAKLHDEVRSACLLFESTLSSKRAETTVKAERAAVNAVMDKHPSFFSIKLRRVMGFLSFQKPLAPGSEINRSWRKANLSQGGVA